MFVPLLLAVCVLAQTPAAVKKRIAVMDFEYTSEPGDGTDFADLLTARLAASGRYTVVERKTVKKYAVGELADPRFAATLGRRLGADGVVVGIVTGYKGAPVTSVEVGARLLSTETTEILAVVNAKGESTALALADLASKIDGFSEKLPTYIVKVSGLIADVAGKTVVLNVGSKAGLQVGDRLQVVRPTRQVKDPTTGAALRKLEESVGEVTIVEIDDSSSICRFTGPALANVGDSVRKN